MEICCKLVDAMSGPMKTKRKEKRENPYDLLLARREGAVNFTVKGVTAQNWKSILNTEALYHGTHGSLQTGYPTLETGNWFATEAEQSIYHIMFNLMDKMVGKCDDKDTTPRVYEYIWREDAPEAKFIVIESADEFYDVVEYFGLTRSKVSVFSNDNQKVANALCSANGYAGWIMLNDQREVMICNPKVYLQQQKIYRFKQYPSKNSREQVCQTIKNINKDLDELSEWRTQVLDPVNEKLKNVHLTGKEEEELENTQMELYEESKSRKRSIVNDIQNRVINVYATMLPRNYPITYIYGPSSFASGYSYLPSDIIYKRNSNKTEALYESSSLPGGEDLIDDYFVRE